MIINENIICPSCKRINDFSELKEYFLKDNISDVISCKNCGKIFEVKYKLIFDSIEEILEQEPLKIQRKEFEDCCGCANSMVTDEDKLKCILKQKIVKDDDICEDFNK